MSVDDIRTVAECCIMMLVCKHLLIMDVWAFRDWCDFCFEESKSMTAKTWLDENSEAWASRFGGKEMQACAYNSYREAVEDLARELLKKSFKLPFYGHLPDARLVQIADITELTGVTE